MTKVMEGVRVLEVAQFTFVPAAGAILADWGADVIKIEHPERGDTQRGFINLGGVKVDPRRNTLIEHPNRGKRSVGVDMSTPEGQQVIYEIAKTCDVFLTNLLPAARQKNKIDIEHIRAANPNIIYARGSAYGDKGPERETGGFDGTGFWSRGGLGVAFTPKELDGTLGQAVPAFGDSIGGMNIAGGISAALFHRERTGEATEIDVSLLSTAWWAVGAAADMGMLTGRIPEQPMPRSGPTGPNPLMGNYHTSDGRSINMCTLTPGPHLKSFFEHIGRPDVLEDERYNEPMKLFKAAEEIGKIIADAFAEHDYAYWCKHLKTYSGQWAPVQSILELAEDEQALANDMIFEVEPADGGEPLKLVRGPVQFDKKPVETIRAPEASEHTELFLMEIGMEWDKIEELKNKGAIA